jgi:hypothetical protein
MAGPSVCHLFMVALFWYSQVWYAHNNVAWMHWMRRKGAFTVCRWVGARMDAIAFVLVAVAVIVAMAAKTLMSASLLALALTHLLQLSGSMQVRPGTTLSEV